MPGLCMDAFVFALTAVSRWVGPVCGGSPVITMRMTIIRRLLSGASDQFGELENLQRNSRRHLQDRLFNDAFEAGLLLGGGIFRCGAPAVI